MRKITEILNMIWFLEKEIKGLEEKGYQDTTKYIQQKAQLHILNWVIKK